MSYLPAWFSVRRRFGLAFALALAGCGGGDGAPAQAPRAATIGPLAATAAASSVAPDELMDWAQREYPALFPDQPATQLLEPYRYRYYPSSRNYLGIAGADVYVLGPVSGDQLLKVGTLEDFKCKVSPALCAVSAGQTLFAAQSMSASIGSDGLLTMWGNPADLRLAAGAASVGGVARVVPIRATQLAVGTYGALILDTEGRVHEYGGAQASWLYDPIAASDIPRQVPRDQRVRQILVSGRTGVYAQPFYLMQDGTLRVHSSGPAGLSGLKGLVALSHGSGVAHAIKSDGKVIRLENSSVYGVFAEIQDASDVKMVSCSGSHCLGLRNDGSVIAWGNDPLLQAQIPDAKQRQMRALPVAGLTNAVKVSAGDGRSVETSAVLTAEGKLYMWGQLAGGGLGVGLQPALVTGLGKVIDVSCASHCLVRTEDGSVWGWGFDKLAITGSGRSTENVASPVRIEGLGAKPSGAGS